MRLFQGAALGALAGFLALTVLVSAFPTLQLDVTITRAIQRLPVDVTFPLMRLVSWPGYAPQVLGVLLGLSLLVGWRLGRRAGWLAAGLGVASLALNSLVKVAIHRPRPTADLVTVMRQVANYSFPSGHVMFYTAFFGFLFFLIYALPRQPERRHPLRWLAQVLCGALVVLVGPSRIYLGAHWASDVLAAYLLGGLLLAGGVWVYRRVSQAGA
jgi:undecaprenyl-diphosphatase